ncbi:MAG: caspase family protein [Methyloceanibacter sp.]
MVAAPALADQRVALVIGNDAYSSVPVLQKAAADARTMAASLSKLGFDVDSGVNISRTETNRKLQDFLNRIEPGDVALFYFAGHGVEIAGANYLLPIDIPEATPGNEEFLKSEAISLNAVLDGLRDRKARVNILVIDACRDNPFAIKTGRSVGGTRGLALVVPPQGTFIMYSAGAGEAALDRLSDADPEPNSVFTRTFVPLLAQGGLNLPELARETRRRVHDLAASSGRSQTPAYYDEVLGDFSFGPGSGPEAVAPSAKTQGVPPSPPGQPGEKLARLPDAVPPEAPRPRAPRENCSRSGNATFCVSSALPPGHGNSYGARRQRQYRLGRGKRRTRRRRFRCNRIRCPPLGPRRHRPERLCQERRHLRQEQPRQGRRAQFLQWRQHAGDLDRPDGRTAHQSEPAGEGQMGAAHHPLGLSRLEIFGHRRQ